MYQKIEEEFKRKSTKNKHAILFLVFVLAYIIIFATVLYKLNYSDYRLIIATVVGVFLMYLIAYLYIFVRVNKLHKLTIKEIGDFEVILNIFKDDMQEADVNCIQRLIKENGIQSKEDIKEALRHYQSLLPRKMISNGALISILAFSISVLSFINSAQIETLKFNIELVGIISGIIIILYLAITTLNDKFFKIFGKYTLYERIEAALSKIYFSYSTEQEAQLTLDEKEGKEIKNEIIKDPDEQVEKDIVIDGANIDEELEEKPVDNVDEGVNNEDLSANEKEEIVIPKEAYIDSDVIESKEDNANSIENR